MRQPLTIGLTGGVGAGKSTVAEELKLLGAEVVSGDELGRRALEESPKLLHEIRQKFGEAVFDGEGKLRRRALGQMIFADPAAARWLTERTFPDIHHLWHEAVAATPNAVIVLDAALIFEWGIEREFDLLVVVYAPPAEVIRRMTESGRLTEAEIKARLAAQIPPEEKVEAADVVLENASDFDDFRRRIHKFWHSRVLPEVESRKQAQA